MLRIAIVIAAFSALLGGTVAARAADAPATGLVARLADCDLTGAGRSATFYARMETLPSVSRLALRFQLMERVGRGAWERIDVPALRQWHTSVPGVKRFGWRQTVENLQPGSAYRARVQYRWLTPGGAVTETRSKDTPVCRGPLPNLAIGALVTKPGATAGTLIYRVEVRNTGKTALEDVDISLKVDRAVLDTVTLSRLAGEDVRVVSFTGPACRRGVRVEADPDDAIGERSESDNSQLFTCP